MPPKGTHHSDEAKAKLKAGRARQVHPRLAKRGLTLADVERAAREGKRWCSGKCKAFVPFAEFSNDRVTQCRDCAAESVAEVRDRWTPEQRAAMAENIAAWRKENESAVRRAVLKKKYGVTPEWYEAKLAEQGGHCALCPTDMVAHRKFLFVDHHHGSGKVRGILCYRCNTFLGQVENPEWLALALAYLQKYS